MAKLDRLDEQQKTSQTRIKELIEEILQNYECDKPELFKDYLRELCTLAEPTLEPNYFLGHYFNEKYANNWLRGSIIQKGSELNSQNMAKLIWIFAFVYPILTHPDAIDNFISTASTRIFDEIQQNPLYMTLKAYIECRYDAQKYIQVDYTKIETSHLIKRKQYNKVCDYIRNGKYDIILISGGAGSGKTTLLNFLRNDEALKDLFRNRILYASLGNNRGSLELRRLCSILEKDQIDLKSPIEAIKNKIRQNLRGKKYLILYDDFPDFDPSAENDFLELADTEAGSVYVITTYYSRIDQKLPDRMVMTGLDRIEDEEMQSLYATLRNKKRPLEANEQEDLIAIASYVNKNIGALAMLFRMNETLSEIRKKLEEVKTSATDPSADIYLPLQIAYSKLPPELKEFYKKLSCLPICSKYDIQTLATAVYENKKEWKVTQWRLEKLSQYMPVNLTDDNAIVINPYVLTFSKMVKANSTANYNEEKEIRNFFQLATKQGLHHSFWLRNCECFKNLSNVRQNTFFRNLQCYYECIKPIIKRPFGQRKFYTLEQTPLIRSLRWLLSSDYVTEWEMILRYSSRFHIRDLIYAYRYKQLKNCHRFSFVGILLSVIISSLTRLYFLSVALILFGSILLIMDEIAWNFLLSRFQEWDK
mgnify:CR=1 FL=1